MKKKILAFCIIVTGFLLLGYGFVTAPVSNKSEIFTHYECGRITKDLRPTDEYCSNPSSAPYAKKHFGNTFVYTGGALIALGGLYSLVALNTKRK